jgi:hypothetical protein
MVVITQYIYATRNAFISDAMRFVAQTNVCATHSTDVALAQLRQEGYPVRDEDVTRWFPFDHKQHINLLGRYFFAVHEAFLEASYDHYFAPTMQMLYRVLRSIAP